jgi:hypothetical protein
MMRSYKSIWSVLAAMVALGTVMATPAFAAESGTKAEGEANYPLNFTIEFKKNRMESISGESVTCKKAKGTGQLSNREAGILTIDFEQCFSGTETVKCNSLGDAAGVILMQLDLLSVFDDLTPLAFANVLTILPAAGVHIECTALVLLLVKGKFLSLVTGITSGTAYSTANLPLAQSKGKPSDLIYWTFAGVESNLSAGKGILVSKNGGAFEEAAAEAEEGKLTPEVSWVSTF